MTTKFIAVCVEDDKDTCLLFKHVINGLGGTLIESANVADGWAAIQEHHPQLVLLDLALPRKSGWEVVNQVRADVDLKDTPIVVVTIRDQDEEQYHGRPVDLVQDYITKPFGVAALEARIRNSMGL